MPDLTPWSPYGALPKSIDYLRQLSAAEVKECEEAVQHIKRTQRTPEFVSAVAFPLPTLGPILKSIACSLHQGVGFSLIRGLDPSKYSDKDIMTIFLGICSHVGSQRGSQNNSRNMITHIIDAMPWQNVPPERQHGIHTDLELPFHTHLGCELVALQYRQVAEKVGITKLSSAAAIYQDLFSEPDVLQTLSESDWPVRIRHHNNMFYTMPLLAYHQGHVIISVDPGSLGPCPGSLRGAAKDSDLTDAQRHAIGVLNDLAEKHSIPIPAQVGDILLFNNLGFLHRRELFDVIDAAGTSGPDSDHHLASTGLRGCHEGFRTQGSEGVHAASYVQDNRFIGDKRVLVDEVHPLLGSARVDSSCDRVLAEPYQRANHDEKWGWLTRLWMRNDSLGWAIPDNMKQHWERVYGCRINKVFDEQYNTVPELIYKSPRNTSGRGAG